MYSCKGLVMSQIKNQNKTRYSTISYAIALIPLLTACGNGGSPSPSPTPAPATIPALTITSNQNPQAGGSCSTITATVPSAVSSATVVALAVSSDSSNYGFAAATPYPSSTSCTIASGQTACSTAGSNNMCAASGVAAGTQITVVGGAGGYSSGSTNLTVAVAPTTLVIASSKRPYAGGSCSNITATTSQTVLVNETINFSVSGSGAGESFGFGLANSASYPTTASCTIAAGNTSCSLVAESLCATESAVAKTPIAIAASAASGRYSANANTTVTATYAYIGNGGSGVIQCLVSDLNGTLSQCATQDDPITSDDLASVTLDPFTSYLYLLPSTIGNYYYACPVNASGQYTNPSCLPSKAITTQYKSIAFALTGGTEYAYLAGNRTGTSGGAVDYCLVQESVLYCQPQYTGFTNPNNVIAATVNQTTYIYVTTLTGSIQKCNINNSAGFGNCTSNVVGSISSNKSGLSVGYDNIASLPAESSNYYGYITVLGSGSDPDSVWFCPIDSTTGMLDCNTPYPFTGIQYVSGGTDDIASVSCTANYTSPYNNQPYLYVCGAGSNSENHIYICPINNLSYDNPPEPPTGGDADACYTSIVTNSTRATNISFGTY